MNYCPWTEGKAVIGAFQGWYLLPRNIEDVILAVMARLVILLYLSHVYLIVAKNFLIQTEGTNKIEFQHWLIDKVKFEFEKYKKT